jgi:predicted ATP-binding protein involved in virulence
MSEPAYLSELTIGNIRCFGQPQTVKLGIDGSPIYWTVILGNNGTGKTTLLQALAAFADLISNKDDFQQALKFRSFLLENLRSKENDPALDVEILLGDDFRSFKLPSHHKKDIFLMDAAKKIASIAQVGLGFGSIFDSLIDKIMEIKLEETPQISTVFVAYSSGRRSAATGKAENFASNISAPLSSDDAPIRNPSDWLLQLDYSAAKAPDENDILKRHSERVKDALIDLLPDISDIRFVVGEAPKYQSRVEFCTPDGWLTIDKLSLGYRTLTTWMVDFARRLFEHYPDSENPLAEPAVCLVDEIDLHMHPQWQRQVMQYLRDKFPRTQFIVTAHSPLVVQASASAGANIAVLRRTDDGVVIDQSLQAVRGWRIDQLLTSDLFGLATARPPEFDGLMARRKELLTKPGLSDKEQRELADLDAKLHSLPGGETPEEMDAMDIIKRAAARLKAGESAGS